MLHGILFFRKNKVVAKNLIQFYKKIKLEMENPKTKQDSVPFRYIKK